MAKRVRAVLAKATTSRHRGRWSSMAVRAARALAFTVIVVSALLTFPSAIPWMIALWIAWHTLAVYRGRPGWLPLVAGIGILLVKRVGWTPSLVLLMLVMSFGALMRFLQWKRAAPSTTRTPVTTLAIWFTWGLFLFDWNSSANCNHPVELYRDRPVVCIGDSVTSGLIPERGYPDVLDEMIALRVINLGRSGINTEAALRLLPRVQEAHPGIVVIEIGGHDFLQGNSRKQTQHNLETLITRCREMGAEVFLFEVPRGFMTDPFVGLERGLAREYDLQLINDSIIRRFVLWSPISPPGMWFPKSHLSDDGIHPNRRGTRRLAESVADALAQVYGKEIILRPPPSEPSRSGRLRRQ